MTAFPFNTRPEQAFPSTFKSLDGKEHIHAWGMTLRDYFAAKAMPPMLHANAGRWAGNYAAYAKMAYEFADAMLEARKV